MKNSKNSLLWFSLLASAGIAFSAGAATAARADLSPAVAGSIKASLSGVKLVEAPYRAAKLVSSSAKADRSAVVRAAVEEVLTQHPTAVAATVRAVLTVAPDESAAVMAAVLSKSPKSYRVAMVVIAEIAPSSIQQVANLVSSELPEVAVDAQKIAQVATPVQSPDNGISGINRFGQFFFVTKPVIVTVTAPGPVSNPADTNPVPTIKIIRQCGGYVIVPG